MWSAKYISRCFEVSSIQSIFSSHQYSFNSSIDGILDRQKSGTKFRYNRITLIDSKESSSKSKKKRGKHCRRELCKAKYTYSMNWDNHTGLDEETCIDENENVEQLVSEVKSTTPKWNHILNQVRLHCKSLFVAF